MQTLYNLASGPCVWVAFIVFIGGSIWKISSLISLAKKKDIWMLEYWSWSHAINSYLHWLIPFGTENSRKQPVMTIVTFLFHVGLLIVPLFTLGHVVLLEESSLGLSWATLPDGVVDTAAWIVVLGGVYFLVRRLTRPEIQYVTSPCDFCILGIALAPFVTGIMAYHGWGNPLLMTTLHMFAGELMLMAIPFTRLSHMLTFWITRGYTASEFGAIRKVQDW